MLKKEFVGVFKSKKTQIFIVIILLISFLDIFILCEQTDWLYDIAHIEETREYDKQMYLEAEKEEFIWISSGLLHPASAGLLAGESQGHYAQYILIWLLPLFVLNLYSDRYVSESKRKYTNALFTRKGKGTVYLSKFITAFLIPFAVYGGVLLINYAVTQVMFMGGYNLDEYKVFAETEGGFYLFMYNNPNITYLTYTILTAVLAGLCGVIGQCVSIIYKNYVVSYMLTFLIWLFFVMNKQSVVYAIQPFTEYGLDSVIKSSALVGVTTMTILVITCITIRNRKDELT